jgi:uncharacterized protein YndB with AHSA1/START domain
LIVERQGVVEREALVLTRVYPVAPAKVWRAWTDPAALRVWWNQADSPRWVAELDVRVGGRYRVVLRDPEGEYHDVCGVYREVVPNRRLVFTWNLHDGPPERMSVVTIELRAVDTGTELNFRQEPIFDPRARDGWRGAFKRLGLLLQQQD